MNNRGELVFSSNDCSRLGIKVLNNYKSRERNNTGVITNSGYIPSKQFNRAKIASIKSEEIFKKRNVIELREKRIKESEEQADILFDKISSTCIEVCKKSNSISNGNGKVEIIVLD